MPNPTVPEHLFSKMPTFYSSYFPKNCIPNPSFPEHLFSKINIFYSSYFPQNNMPNLSFSEHNFPKMSMFYNSFLPKSNMKPKFLKTLISQNICMLYLYSYLLKTAHHSAMAIAAKNVHQQNGRMARLRPPFCGGWCNPLPNEVTQSLWRMPISSSSWYDLLYFYFYLWWWWLPRK